MIKIIGLVDYDFLVSKKTSILLPNIEIMKLANYYKIEENQFCRLLILEEKELDNYDKIYFFSELHKPIIPENYLRSNNVIYGGTGFTKEYIPFENEIIDFTLPKTFIYADFLKKKYNDGVKSKIISRFLDNTYYRNYAGKNKLPLPYIIPNKQVFLYDKDFFYNDWEETLNEIVERKPSCIFRIHPIICKNLTNYFKIRNFNKFARENKVILDLDIPLEEVNYMLNHYKNLFLGDITLTSNIYIPLGGELPTRAQYFRDFIYKLNLLYSFWSRSIPIKIDYQEPENYNNPLHNLSLEIKSISELNTERKKIKTLNDKINIKRKHNIFQEEKDYLLKFHPTAKSLFEQSFNSLKKRGDWRI